MEIRLCIDSFQTFFCLDLNSWGLRLERLRVMGLKVVVVVVMVVGQLVLRIVLWRRGFWRVGTGWGVEEVVGLVLWRWEIWRAGIRWDFAEVVSTWEREVVVLRWGFWIGRLWQRLEVRVS